MPTEMLLKSDLLNIITMTVSLLSVTVYSDGISYKLEDKVIYSKITYRAGMYFDELFGKIIK